MIRYQHAIEEGRSLRKLGDCAKAEHAFQQAANQGKLNGNQVQQAQALQLLGGCQIRRFHYGAALRTFASARDLAMQANDKTILGALAANVSTVYFQVGDTMAASRTAAESIEFLTNSPRRDYYANSLIIFGDIQFGLGRRASGKSSLTRAMDVAKEAHLSQIEALAANHLSSWLIITNDLPNARLAISRALAVSEIEHDKNGLSEGYEHLAELEWRQGGSALPLALAHIDKAFAYKSQLLTNTPQYYPIHIRAQILLSLGRRDQALIEFRRAVDSADNWRQTALPGDATATQTVAQLESVYKDCAHLAAQLALSRSDHSLARDAFEILARNRAASLREQLTRSYSSKLLDSPKYFDLLQQLQTAQASATLGSDSNQTEPQRQKLNQIRASLSDLENRIGLDQQNFGRVSEKKDQRNSLKGIQARLSPSEALLSFSLGEHSSFLWAITSDQVRLYELPGQETIAHQAATFSRAVSEDRTERVAAGRALSRSLFSPLTPAFKRKPNWLLTLDGALLDKVPFSAIPAVFEGSDQPLIASHTLRILPSALLARSTSRAGSRGGFVGVADPIYSLADSRLDRNKRSSKEKTKMSAKVLARLLASQVEIKAAAEKCGLPQPRLLTGKDASGVVVREAIQKSPEILHFAVHVISPTDFPQEAALALSITKDNLPELLTAESAATYHVPGSLVVLSGCASQQGDVLPGAGLVGLSRGWLLAGAAAVVVSAWPTPENSGPFFPTFYAHYRQASGSVAARAAKALQQTQLDMQHGGKDLSVPQLWAAYSIISKE